MMTSACKKLENIVINKEMYLLKNIWMYYDPTDFPSRKNIDPIFIKKKHKDIYNINKRIKYKEINKIK